MKIYAISGLGANEKVFEKLVFPVGYELIVIPWLIPHSSESIQSYAFRMSENIDVSEDFALLGLSFGGIIAQIIRNQLTETVNMKRQIPLILFSTISSEKEKPFWISINRFVPFYKLFPNFLLTYSPLIGLYSLVQSLFSKNLPSLKVIYTMRDSQYISWAFRQVIYSQNVFSNSFSDSRNRYHFHGTSDFVFPIWNIENPIRIPHAGHLAVYEKAEVVNKYWPLILKN